MGSIHLNPNSIDSPYDPHHSVFQTPGWFKLSCQETGVCTAFPRPPALIWDEEHHTHLPVPDEFRNINAILPPVLHRDVLYAVMALRFHFFIHTLTVIRYSLLTCRYIKEGGGVHNEPPVPGNEMSVRVLLAVNTCKKNSDIWDFSFSVGVFKDTGDTGVGRSGYSIFMEDPDTKENRYF